MCGRFYLKTPPAKLMDRFELDTLDFEIDPHENVCPTEDIPVVLHESPTTLSGARWGLIPSWSKDLRVGAKMINARSETVAEHPAFRKAFDKRRCLVLADGFYEWRKDEGKRKTPIAYSLASGQPLAFAGLWEWWKRPGGEWLRSCTIITTAANDLVMPVHDRMPVILLPDQKSIWLDVDASNAMESISLLRAFPADQMTSHEVSPELLVIQRKPADTQRSLHL